MVNMNRLKRFFSWDARSGRSTRSGEEARADSVRESQVNGHMGSDTTYGQRFTH